MADEEVHQSIGDLAGLLVTPSKGSEKTAKTEVETHDDVGDDETEPKRSEKPAKTAKAEWFDEDDEDGNSDEETDDAPKTDDGEGDETDGEGDDTVDPTEPLYTVTIDGKQERVTLKEALAGYQRTKDYTRKTEELAAKRKAQDAEFEGLQQARGGYEGVLKQLLERIGPEDQERTPEQWAELRRTDEQSYATAWADFQRRQEQRTAIKAEQKRVSDEKTHEARGKLQEFVNGQRDLLIAAIPEWKEPTKYEAGAKKVFAFAKEVYGFTDQELATAYDHRIIRMAEDARKYREMLARRAKAAKQLRDAPEVPAPSTRPAQQGRKAAVKEAAQKRFDRSGKIDDAVPLLFK